MQIQSTVALAIAALTSFAGVASAQQSEAAIRCVASNTEVVGSVGQELRFTASGRPSDFIVTPFYSGRLDQAPNVWQVVIHSDGNCSFRFGVPFNPQWNGSIILVARNGNLVDVDRIVCR